MRTRFRFVAVLVSVGVLAVACGGDDDDASDAVPASSDSTSSGADDGGGTGESNDDIDGDAGSDGAVGSMDLGDFPIPAPAGGTVEFDQTSDVRVVSYPLTELDNIETFYGDWIAAGDWSPPEGAQSSVTFSEDLGQLIGTAWLSETQRYSIIGTPDGDRIEIALSVEG